MTATFTTSWDAHELYLHPLPARSGNMSEIEWLTLAVEHVHRQEQAKAVRLDRHIVRAKSVTAQTGAAARDATDMAVQAFRADVERDGSSSCSSRLVPACKAWGPSSPFSAEPAGQTDGGNPMIIECLNLRGAHASRRRRSRSR